MTRRFPIRFDPIWKTFFTLLFLSPSQSYLEIREDEVEVRMAWAFRARFPRGAVTQVEASPRRVLSIGVHGMFGRWLVNGSSGGLAILTLEPVQRGRVLGFPVQLRELTVSVEDPEALGRALVEE